MPQDNVLKSWIYEIEYQLGIMETEMHEVGRHVAGTPIMASKRRFADSLHEARRLLAVATQGE